MKQPWMRFFVADWRSKPALRLCSLQARGLWIDMLCLMHFAEPRGSLLIEGASPSVADLAGLINSPVKSVQAAISELEQRNIFSRDADGTIFSRRMRKDTEKQAKDTNNGGKGGHPGIRRGTVPKEDRVRRFRRSDSPEKAKRIYDRTLGCCHWCGSTLNPSNYHIDHVVAVRDGGSNDEDNLVAACPDCNGERAMLCDPTIREKP